MSHAACIAGKIVMFEVGIRKRLSGVHKAKKCRKVWGETPCSRAGPHPSGWRSPGRDHLGEWGAGRALEREERSQVVHGKRSPLAAWQTRESTRRACMALEASGFSGRGWRWPTAMKSDQDGRTAHPGLEKMAAQELLLRQ